MFILFQKQLTKENLKITLLSRNWQLCEFNKIQVTQTEPGATDREARETRDITYNSLHTHWLPHSLSSLPLLSLILYNNKFKRSQMQTFDKNFHKLLFLGLLKGLSIWTKIFKTALFSPDQHQLIFAPTAKQEIS